MKDQILKLIETEGLTPTKFADEIGVQRSSISHIISGRNKPSYDFIVKILARFPGINAEWLLTGEGTMIKSSNSLDNGRNRQDDLFSNAVIYNHEGESSGNQIQGIKPSKDSKPTDLVKEEIPSVNKTKKEPDNTAGEELTNVNNVDYLVIFYSNGTFERFTPRKK